MDFLTNLLTSTYASFSVASWMTFLIIMAIYYTAEFRTKSDSTAFDWKRWINENWFNLIVSTGFFYLYNSTSAGTVQFATLAFIATAPNLLIDWVMTLRYKSTH